MQWPCASNTANTARESCPILYNPFIMGFILQTFPKMCYSFLCLLQTDSICRLHLLQRRASGLYVAAYTILEPKQCCGVVSCGIVL